MKAFHLLSTSAVAVALVACAPKQQGGYDTANPYAAPSAANAPYQPDAPANPTYDTPAAYEDSTATVTPTTEPAGVTPATPPVANQAAATHTVVKGDTLGGIATKYKVPMVSIMKANNMTKDTVVLGKKLIIPAH